MQIHEHDVYQLYNEIALFMKTNQQAEIACSVKQR